MAAHGWWQLRAVVVAVAVAVAVVVAVVVAVAVAVVVVGVAGIVVIDVMFVIVVIAVALYCCNGYYFHLLFDAVAVDDVTFVDCRCVLLIMLAVVCLVLQSIDVVCCCWSRCFVCEAKLLKLVWLPLTLLQWTLH